MDIGTFLTGIAVGAGIMLATGFFKKAGEDGYKLLKKKFFPNSNDEHHPNVIVQVSQNRILPESANKLSPSSVERISKLTYDEITKTIRNSPPLQQDSISKNYVGLHVEWDAYLRSASKGKEGLIRLLLSDNARSHLSVIICTVRFDDYRELSVLPQGAKIQLKGKISYADSVTVELEDVQLSFYDK